ncbi:hypothetical protein TKK_0008507 [Trichogramma kaykai]|uniref:Structural maintenance of chromosomes protein 5 n=1 Tax=Trichogramma kaykai TaxID=54128 RepID=A0ABD2X591_9HYME
MAEAIEPKSIESGVIIRLGLKNFVTYDEVVVKPGRNLNLIIGANGTGKSTIVMAIVLGLGGSPKVIGRQSNVGEFVKAGEKNATIEIDLQLDANRHITVKRCFNDAGQSQWFVNNQSVTAKKINDLMKSLNIQVDNLCQFLPQDKVQQFSELTPAKLLTETERSVGDPKLIEYHTKLNSLREEQVELEKNLEGKTKLHHNDEKLYSSLKDSIGQITERQKLAKKLSSLKQKKAWMQYQHERDKFKDAKEGMKQALEKKNEIKRQLEPMEQEISRIKNNVQEYDRIFKQHQTEVSHKTNQLSQFINEIEKNERKITDLTNQCDNDIRQEEQRDQQLDEMKQQLNKMENDLSHLVENVGTAESLRAEFEKITPRMSSLRNKINEFNAQQQFKRERIDHLNRKIHGEEQYLKEIQDIENKRLQRLRSISQDAYKGVIWLRENKHLFSRTVHEPMILQINLKDPGYSKYFENIISSRDLTAFICEDKNDLNKLLHCLRTQQKLVINAVHIDPERRVNFDPRIPLYHLQRYGFENYLIDLIEAPEIILKFLVIYYSINQIPIGSEQVAMNIDQIPDEIRRYFTPSNSYSISKSKYTGDRSTRQAAIFSQNILSITVDHEKMKYHKSQIQTFQEQKKSLMIELESFDGNISEVHREINELKDARNIIQANINKLSDIERRINVQRNRIRTDESDRKSVDEIRASYNRKIRDELKKQLTVYRQYNKLVDDCYKTFLISEELKLQLRVTKNLLANKNNEVSDLRESHKAAEDNYKILERECKPIKEEVARLFKVAKDSTDGLAYGDENFEPIKRVFARLPGTLPEIFQEIDTTQAQLYCIANAHDADKIMTRFRNIRNNLKILQQQIQEYENNLARVTQEIEKIKECWLPLLITLVDRINANFSAYFKRMKCAGEVSLSIPENDMDFERYGLKIRIKFRDADELQTLTRTHQSGGERTVTTAIYMLALQELTRVPFRCVDEINQGMDAANERRVFEMMVQNTTRATSAQYFLLTPKLLPGLKYNDSVTVLTVFNGKYMIPSSEYNIGDEFENIVQTVSRKRRRESESD